MEKGSSMLRRILALFMLALLSACAGTSASPSATLSPSPEMSETPLPTRTVSSEDMTAFATYRPTYPPTFTPTVTPTITLTPSITPTYEFTPSRTPMPELLLCPGFDVRPFAPQGAQLGVTLQIPQDLAVFIEIIEKDTGEVWDSNLVERSETVTIIFDPGMIPPGDYIWRASLQDDSRTGLCPLQGAFTIQAAPTAESTAELTAESTEALDVTATATRRIRETPQRTPNGR